MSADHALPLCWVEWETRASPGLPAAWIIGTGSEPRTQAGRSLLRRRIARCIVARQLGVSEAAVELGHDALGRPLIIAPPQAGLSLSYATRRGHVLVALAQGGVLGADIEAQDGGEIPWQVLHPDERRFLEAHEKPEAVFTALWAAKEASAKAWGEGLALEPAAFSLSWLSPHQWRAQCAGRAPLQVETRVIATSASSLVAAVARPLGR